VAWITPSELFTPAYGAALGAFILQRHAEDAAVQPLRIVEVGGGNGTLAKDILVRQCIGCLISSQSPRHINKGNLQWQPIWLLHQMLQSCSLSTQPRGSFKQVWSCAGAVAGSYPE
jgi:hypothetical protein